MKLAVAALALAACSIPDVDLSGKHCPCASGYTCNTATDVCVRVDAATDVPADTDIDADTSGVSCIGTTHGAQLFSTDFQLPSDLGLMTTVNGAWSIATTDLVQGNAGDGLAYAYHKLTAPAPADYRVVSKFHMTAGGDGNALEVSLRVQGVIGNHAQYHCNWEPTDGAFLIMRTNANGIDTTVFVSSQVPAAMLPPSSTSVTMEFQIKGTQLSCCLREVPTGVITATDGALSSGSPGFKTYMMSGHYEYMHVFAVP